MTTNQTWQPMESEEEEKQRDERYRDPYPEVGRVVVTGFLVSTVKNEAWAMDKNGVYAKVQK